MSFIISFVITVLSLYLLPIMSSMNAFLIGFFVFITVQYIVDSYDTSEVIYPESVDSKK